MVSKGGTITRYRVLAGILLGLCTGAALSIQAAEKPVYVPDQLLLQPRNSDNLSMPLSGELQEYLQQQRFSVIRILPGGIIHLQLPQGSRIKVMVKQLMERHDVQWVEPNYIRRSAPPDLYQIP